MWVFFLITRFLDVNQYKYKHTFLFTSAVIKMHNKLYSDLSGTATLIEYQPPV